MAYVALYMPGLSLVGSPLSESWWGSHILAIFLQVPDGKRGWENGYLMGHFYKEVMLGMYAKIHVRGTF